MSKYGSDKLVNKCNAWFIVIRLLVIPAKSTSSLPHFPPKISRVIGTALVLVSMYKYDFPENFTIKSLLMYASMEGLIKRSSNKLPFLIALTNIEDGLADTKAFSMVFKSMGVSELPLSLTLPSGSDSTVISKTVSQILYFPLAMKDPCPDWCR